MKGLVFETEFVDPGDKCFGGQNLIPMLIFALDKTKEKVPQKILKKCLLKNKRVRLDLTRQSLLNLSSVERKKIYRKFKLKNNLVNKLEEIVHKKAYVKKKAQWDELFLQVEKIFKKKKKDEYSKLELLSLLELSERIEESVWKDLILSVVYSNLGNLAQTNYFLDKILRTSPINIFYSLDMKYVSKGDKDLLALLSILLDRLQENFKDSTKLKMVAKYFEYYLDLYDKRELSNFCDRYDCNWSLKEIREIMNSPIYGYYYVSFWYFLLLKRSTFTEANYFAQKAVNYDLINYNFEQYFPIFEYYFPAEEKIRKLIVEKLITILKSNNYLLRELAIRVLSNKDISDYIYKNTKYKLQPLFKLKRTHYNENIKHGRAIKYSIYNLLLLGDFNYDYVLWLGVN